MIKTDEKIACSVVEAAELIGVSKTKMYEIIRRPDADFSLKIDGRHLVSIPRLKAWIDRQAEKGDTEQ